MTPQQSEVDVTTSKPVTNKIPKINNNNKNNNNTTVTTTTKTRIKTKAQSSNDSVPDKVDATTTTTKTTTKFKKSNKTANEINTTTLPSNPQSNKETVEKNYDGNDNKFLERVFAAMKSSQPRNNESKPPIPPTTQKYLSNGCIENKPLLNGSRPPPHPTSVTKKLNSSSTIQQQSSKIFQNHNPCVNGYAEGVPLSTSNTGNNNYINVVDDDDSIEHDPVVAVTLTIPISTTDKMSSTSNKYNYLSGSATTTTSTSSERRTNSYLLNRSPSPTSSVRSSSSRCSSITSTSSKSSHNFAAYTPPRRVFPQTYTRGRGSIDLHELQKMESSPVIFDANMSFVLGCKKQPVHQTFKPTPSFMDDRTSSAYLSEKIQNFLKRTDHVQEEWTAMGRRSRSRRNGSINSRDTTPTNSLYDDYDTISLIERQRERKSMERASSVGRSRSSQNILTKAFQLTKTLPRMSTSRSNSLAREMSEEGDDDRTIHEEDDLDFDELSEMTVDLQEERSTANIASERLEAETAERLKLEKELNDSQSKVKNLQEATEKLEMELICAKSDLNGSIEEEDNENEENNGGAVYKLKYERVARELEFTKRRLQSQHEHDLEQLVGLKKQLEKKLADAYEEVEEQRQVVGQWKRKAQKMTNEMNDLRMLLEEQNARNNLLEKKQRKFDAECQALQDATRQEKQAKERFSREKDVLIAEKFTLEQNLGDTRLELELKEEKMNSLQRELEEMTFGGGTEEEVAQLRRAKNELERRLKEQEEELDEMAGQVQLLEQAKLRLEMSLETMRKDARREAQQRDEELEEARGSAYKKIKGLLFTF